MNPTDSGVTERLEPPERIRVVVRAATDDDWIGVAYCKDYKGDPSTIHEYRRASVAAPQDCNSKIPQPALYWLKAAKDESHSMAERLFYMENAYNHVVNALHAAPSTTPVHPFGPCGYQYCDWPDGELRCNERRGTPSAVPSDPARRAAEELNTLGYLDRDLFVKVSDQRLAQIVATISKHFGRADNDAQSLLNEEKKDA